MNTIFKAYSKHFPELPGGGIDSCIVLSPKCFLTFELEGSKLTLNSVIDIVVRSPGLQGLKYLEEPPLMALVY